MADLEELARRSLAEVADPKDVGPLVRQVDEGDGVLSLLFECNLPGYPGWKWTVSVAQIGDAEPTVVESELMPGAGALLAPDWVPWSQRLDEYKVQQAEAAAAAVGEHDDDLGDDELDPDDLGDDDYDGVDVDALDEADDEDDDEADDDEDGDSGLDDDDDDHDDPEDDDSEDDAGFEAEGRPVG